MSARIPWVFLLVCLVHCTGARPTLVGASGDDAIYLGVARALADHGGMEVPWLPGAPVIAKYPLGWPLVLAGFARLSGLDTDARLLAPLFFNAAAWGLTAELAVRRLVPRLGGDRTAAWQVAALMTVSTVTIRLVPQLMSEPLFALLSLGTLLVALDAERPGQLILVALLGGAAGAVRSVGGLWLLAGVASAALHRRPKLAVALAVAWAMQAALSQVQRAGVPEPSAAAQQALHYYLSYDAHVRFYLDHPADIPALVGAVARQNLLAGAGSLAEFISPLSFAGGAAAGQEGPGMMAMGAALAALALYGGARTSRAVGLHLLVYIGIFVVWSWPFSVRFWLPVMPLVWSLAVVGAQHLGRYGRLLSWPVIGFTLLLNAPDPFYRARGVLLPREVSPAEADAFDQGEASLRARMAPGDILVGESYALWLARRAEVQGIDARAMLPSATLFRLALRLQGTDDPDGAMATEMAKGLAALTRLTSGQIWVVVDEQKLGGLGGIFRALAQQGVLQPAPPAAGLTVWTVR